MKRGGGDGDGVGEGMGVIKDVGEFIRSFAYKPIAPVFSKPSKPVGCSSTQKMKRKAKVGAAPKMSDEEKKILKEERRKKRAAAAREKAKATKLSAAQKRSDAYKRVAHDCLWAPPCSPYKLLQEYHSFDPWRVLVICMLLNLTTGKQVRQVLYNLFDLCGNAKIAIEVPVEEIEKIIQPLGLQKKRAGMIQRFSCEYLSDDWEYVTELHGIGKYAADAYAIFCAGKAHLVVPHDHKLNEYWKFVCDLMDANGGVP